MSSVIKAERELLTELRRSARRELGTGASEAEVEALVDEAYYGPESIHNRPETEAERQERERRTAVELARMNQWGLPDP